MNPVVKLLVVLALLFLFAPIVVNAQFRPAKCEVQPLWVGNGARSASFGLMGAFEAEGHDTLRSFKLKNTDLIASVGIKFDEDISKYRLHVVRLAITVSNTERDDIFESVENSEARTQYRKGWNLAVTKNINFDNLVYMFTLRCWDAASKKPLL